MEELYVAYYLHRPVGEVRILKCGLYYDIACSCYMEREAVYRLHMDNHCLGTLIPEQGIWQLIVRKSCRCLQNYDPIFTIKCDEINNEEGVFIPLQNGEPISFLHRILEARFYQNDGVSGIWLPNEK